jgi:hypothetical protein
MKNRIVLYFSGTGNNRFLAAQIADELDADLRPLNPRIKSTGLIYLLSLLKWRSGIRVTAEDLQPYEEVVVVGPVYGGLLLAPMREAIRLSAKGKRPVHFATCCGISDEMKDHRYGYVQVLKAAEAAGKGYIKATAAFPVGPALPEGANPNEKDLMAVRLSEENWTEALRRRVKAFAAEIEGAEAIA